MSHAQPLTRNELMNDSALNDRMLALETQNRKIKRALLGLVVVLGTLPLFAFALKSEPQDANYRIVYASKFALRDPRTGIVRAELSHQTMAGGWAGITLWDNDGQPRGEFKLWEDGSAHLTMMDAHRRELSRLSVSKDGQPSLALDGKAIEAK
jgi:hypothetical protein